MPDSDLDQQPKKVGLLELLRTSTGGQFIVPVYQRHYTWTANKEVKQLLNDLENVLNGKYEKHFLGILIYLVNEIDYSERELLIIDGQQRLTTIFLMLYAIEELLKESNQLKEARQLKNRYFYTSQPYPEDDEIPQFKLKPQVSDDMVYQKIVNDDLKNITESEKKTNIYKNYIYLKNYIKGELMKTYTLQEILKGIQGLYVVCVPIMQADNPQKIFESINATGAKLTASDLIRNFILMPCDNSKQEYYHDKYWKTIETYVSTDPKKLESFFRIFMAAKNRDLPNKNEVYEKFVDWFNRQTEKKYSIDDILKDITNYARYYNEIYCKDIKTIEDKESRKTITEFRKINSDMPAPLFLELDSLTEDDKIPDHPPVSKKQLREIINLTNTYLFRRAICGMDTSSITRLFPQILKDVLNECKNDFSNVVEVYKKYLVNRNKGNSMEMPDDAKLEAVVKDENMYNIRMTLRLFFDKLEIEESPIHAEASDLNIEHLMPQTLTKEWRDMINGTEEEYKNNLHRLGNLTLVSKTDNSSMGNSSWESKKKTLGDTGRIKMNEKLLLKEAWTIKDIEDRTNELIKDMIKLYPYFEATNKTISETPISLNADGVTANAMYYQDDGSVLVYEGSVIKTEEDNESENYDIDEQIVNLSDADEIQEFEGELRFTKNHLFQSTNDKLAIDITASLLLHKNCDGFKYWKDENGNLLKK